MNPERVQGVIPPIVTPFLENEEVDLQTTRREVKYLLRTGIDGIAATGSTGEGALLSDEEIQRIVEIVVEENTERIPVIGGVIRNSTRDAIKTAQIAKKAGADALPLEPALALVRAIAPGLSRISNHLVASDRKVGGSMMRLNRDVRFSKDKTPYRTDLGFGFWHDGGKRMEVPGLYLGIADQGSVGT